MRNSVRMLVVAIVLTFGLVSFAAAQMKDDSHKQPAKSDSTATTQPAKMGNGEMMNSTMTPQAMTQQKQMMMTDFTKLQERIDSMMKTNDMKTLKSELKDLQSMVMTMRENMTKNMMSSTQRGSRMNGMADSQGTSGTMGMHTQSTTTPKNRTHSH